MSAWWEDYIQDPQPINQHWSKEFRQNFRLPFALYVMLLNLISSDKSEGLFNRWTKAQGDSSCYERGEGNQKNKKVSPIELLLLGSLQYLRRGWIVADMKDVTCISRDVHRSFFHQFVKIGAMILYPMYMSAPQMVEELRDCEKEYDVAGFPGCIGNTGASHIPLEKVCVSVLAPSASRLQVKKCDADVQSHMQSSSTNLAYDNRPPC